MEENLNAEKLRGSRSRSLEDVMEEASTIGGGGSSASDIPLTDFSVTPCNGEDEIVAIVTKKDIVNKVNMVAYNFLPEMLTQVAHTTTP